MTKDLRKYIGKKVDIGGEKVDIIDVVSYENSKVVVLNRPGSPEVPIEKIKRVRGGKNELCM